MPRRRPLHVRFRRLVICAIYFGEPLPCLQGMRAGRRRERERRAAEAARVQPRGFEVLQPKPSDLAIIQSEQDRIASA